MRITGGTWRGRALQAAPSRGTRPTTDRVREALFTRLGHLDRLAGAVVLDLYCGTACLALEAVSRGAAQAVAVDRAAAAVAVARGNAEQLGAHTVTVAQADVATWLARQAADPPQRRFDLVFCDPPYDLPRQDVAVALESLVAAPLLGEDALVVLEQSRRAGSPPWPAGLEDVSHRDYGETRLWWAYTARAADEG